MERVAGNVSGADFLRDHMAVLPYAGIYFSAQIITELAGAKNPCCSTQSGTALTWNRELVGTDLPLF